MIPHWSMDSEKQRMAMVERQLIAREIRDPRVLAAMRAVPRERFAPAALEELAYEDLPLPIGEGQSMSLPFMTAWLTSLLRLEPDDRVLEIGTGSGYSAAVMSRIAAEVYTVERYASLAGKARERLEQCGYQNISVHCGDGTLGWSEHAPYDAIVVAAGSPVVPPPLADQLAIAGRLVIPIGPHIRRQTLVRVTRVREHRFRNEELGDVQFVPLIGVEAWHGSMATAS